MNDIRILTVRQPWAWAIIHGGKDVENRVRNVTGGYRGPVAIHAGLAEAEKNNLASHERARLHRARAEVDTRLLFGAIIGVVDLVDVHRASQISGCTDSNARSHMRADLCSQWAERDAVHLVLTNPRPLTTPIPYRGALGLRRLDEETTAAVWSQMVGNHVG